ncbi:hypothetical protein Cantr_05074 [Candida viswanathii]|uniref:Uncharacterized protein n=1 Tax=Candida viswanathii TaxID=5486 RepID=A0A367XS00_9ASCO|nr:hypothetical protein Cantr_05074 [Candida viswanathii]
MISNDEIKCIFTSFPGSSTEFGLPFNHLVYLSPEFLPSSLIALDVSHNGIFAFTDFETLTNLEQLDLSTTKLSRFLGLLRDKSYAFPDSIRFVNIEGFGLSYDGAEVLYGELAKKPHFEFLNLYEHPIDAQLVLGAGARLYKVGLLGDCSGFITVNELTRYRTRAPAQEKAVSCTQPITANFHSEMPAAPRIWVSHPPKLIKHYIMTSVVEKIPTTSRSPCSL